VRPLSAQLVVTATALAEETAKIEEVSSPFDAASDRRGDGFADSVITAERWSSAVKRAFRMRSKVLLRTTSCVNQLVHRQWRICVGRVAFHCAACPQTQR